MGERAHTFDASFGRLSQLGVGRLDCSVVARVLLVLLALLIASGNAHWFLWSGLIPSLVIPPVLVILSMPQQLARLEFPRRSVPLVAAMCGLVVVAGVSAACVDPSRLSIVQWTGSYVSLLLVYLGTRATPFNSRLARVVWIAITVGVLIPLVAGLYAYYAEWGIPNALELLTSRYDLGRMAGFMEATFGNTGNTAALLALLVPAWVALALTGAAGWRLRTLCALALVIAFLHAMIVQSRTLLIVLVLVIPVVAYHYRVRIAPALGGALLISAAFLLPLMSEADRLLEMTAGAVSGGAQDQSVEERFEAMRIGIRLMLDNPFLGVGPGNSAKENFYTSAHEFWINQGEEIGVFGLLLCVLITAIVVWRFVGFVRSRANGGVDDVRFAGIAGAFGYLLYGTIANMPLSSSVVNVWVGLLAIMLGLDDARFLDSRPSTPTPKPRY